MAWAAGVSPRESDDWTWGELLNAVDGWQFAMKEQQKVNAQLLYFYGLSFSPRDTKKAPPPWELFPVWDEDEVQEFKRAEILARVNKIVHQKVRP